MSDDLLLWAALIAGAVFVLLHRQRAASPEYRLLEGRVAALEQLAIEGGR